MDNVKQQIKTPSLLHTRKYLAFWLASLVSNIGSWMQQVAQPWIILTMSGSSFMVGLDSFMLNAPGIVFTLWGGILADRLNRKNVILLFQGIQCLSIVILLVLYLVHALQVWMIIVISLVVGTTDSLSMPSFQSIVPSLVKPKDIPLAITLNSTQFNLSRMLGPAIAGVLLAKFGAITCFGANTLSYIPFFVSLYWIYPKKAEEVKKPQAEALSRLRDFPVLLRDHKIQGSLATIFVTSFFCAPLITFTPVLILSIFHGAVGDYGEVMGAFGLGGLLGASMGFIPIPVTMKRNRIASIVALFLGITVFTIALIHSLFLLFALMVIAGITLTLSNIYVGTYLQEHATNSNRGKIVSLYQLSLQAGLASGSISIGILSSHLGIAKALIISGILAAILHFLILKRSVSKL